VVGNAGGWNFVAANLERPNEPGSVIALYAVDPWSPGSAPARRAAPVNAMSSSPRSRMVALLFPLRLLRRESRVLRPRRTSASIHCRPLIQLYQADGLFSSELLGECQGDITNCLAARPPSSPPGDRHSVPVADHESPQHSHCEKLYKLSISCQGLCL
jgi:hypothetical protein